MPQRLECVLIKRFNDLLAFMAPTT